jgi:hypothetical protein
MWPGWSTVVTRPPDAVSAASSSAIAAFCVPYSPIGGEVSSSRIGCLTLGPYRQMVPQWIRYPLCPRSSFTSAAADSGVKQIMSTDYVCLECGDPLPEGSGRILGRPVHCDLLDVGPHFVIDVGRPGTAAQIDHFVPRTYQPGNKEGPT